MIVSILPPHYFPNAETLHKIILSDIHVVLDTIPFNENGLSHRCKIITHSGVSWLTIPVLSKTVSKDFAIRDLQIFTGKTWEKKHLDTIKTSYKKSKYFKKYMPFIEKLFSKKWKNLVELNTEIYTFILREMEIDTRILIASEENINGKYQEQIIKILDKTIARTFLTGQHDKIYFSEEKYTEILDEMKIEVKYQNYDPYPYSQLFTRFTPLASTIDILMNMGPESKKTILKKNISKIKSY